MLRVVLGPAPLGLCQHYTTGILPQLILDLCARMVYHHCHLVPCCNFTLSLNQWRQRLPPAVPSRGAGNHFCFLLLGCEGATGPFGFIPVTCVLDIPASVLEGQLFVVGLVTCQAARLRRNIENTVVCFKKKKKVILCFQWCWNPCKYGPWGVHNCHVLASKPVADRTELQSRSVL